MDLSVSLPYCGMADVKIVKAKVYDYTGLFYCTIKPFKHNEYFDISRS